MSEASVIFLPWVRQGLAARIAAPDPLTAPLPAEAGLGVSLAVNGTEVAAKTVRLFGPADVIGIDPRQVVRMEPPPGTNDYESNDLAAIEFDNPDLPWLFTPAAADAQGRLRPWLVLAVVRRQEGVRLRAPRDEPLPVLEIAPPAEPSAELPDLADSWAWAHAQLAMGENPSEADMRDVLANRPELSVSRLLSPRLLASFTDYIACVVPAFEAGRLAGLCQPVDAAAPLAPAWASGAAAPAQVTLPVYHHWEFRTGAREDFESLVARLAPRDLSGTGRRPMDIREPGFTVPAGTAPTVLLEGALQPVGAPQEPWPDDAAKPWQDKLQAIVNASNARATPADAEPVVGPPIYGRWYAGRHEVGTAGTPTWLDELNLDPRYRVVAALGTRIIQQHQERLVAEAWEQAGEMAQANQRLRQMQLSLAITSRMHVRYVERLDDDDALWRFAAPAQSRLVLSAASPGAAAMSLRTMLAQSATPNVTISAAMRRLTRPRGAISRRATMALEIAGGSARGSAQVAGVSTLFRLYASGQPQLMIFVLPPTRGMVSFDAVTRRLPAQFAFMVYRRATDAEVARMPGQPEFEIIGEPLRVTGVFAGVAAHAATLSRPQPRLRRVDEEPPDFPEEPERPEPIPPHRPPPQRFDSPDAKAFREAASRHLAHVNPQAPLILLRPVQRPVFDPAAARAEVRALLDPAPALQLRMTATIRMAGPEQPREIGPLGGTPVFTQPMSEPLAALSQDWLLPGLDQVPPDSVALLQPNPRFIEAYLLGLNVEMGRELLWRDFAVSDARATYFRRFWRAVQPAGEGDIAAIKDWAERRLGDNTPASDGSAGAKQVVLLVRSLLVRRYPNAAVYAVPAVPATGGGRQPGGQGAEIHPLFRGTLQPDVSFFGFALDAAEATGDPGWYFVIQQQPTEPRFGFDVDIDFGGAAQVPLVAPPAGHALPPGTEWARNAAHMARITRQQPMRVAIHASELI